MAADPQAFIDTIISNAITTANEMTDKVSDAADDLIHKNAGFYIAPPSSATGFVVSAVEPDIPAVADNSLVYEAQLAALVALLSAELAGFFDKYYPLKSDAFDEATDWLLDAINGGTGVNATVAAQLWQRDRDNLITDGRRASNMIIAGYAAKGIQLAPGSMIRRIDEITFEQAAKIGVASTTISAKQFDTEIETVKFAVGEALKSRQMAMTAAADYIRAIASAPDSAAKVANLNGDAQARMMSSAADFYRARMGRDDLILRSRLAEIDTDVEVYKHRRDNATSNDEVEVRALSAAAQAFGQSASAALSSLNSIVSSATNAFS